MGWQGIVERGCGGARVDGACHVEGSRGSAKHWQRLPACALAAPPRLQARLHEAQAASARLAAAEAEGADLVRRLVEAKEKEAERMNEINKLEADTVRWLAGWRRRCCWRIAMLQRRACRLAGEPLSLHLAGWKDGGSVWLARWLTAAHVCFPPPPPAPCS